MKKIIAALLVFLMPASPAFAAFEDLGAGARAPGMGNAFTALADDVHAIYYNPAGLAQLERPQASATYSKLYTGLSDGSDLGLSQISYAQPLKLGRNGTVATSLQRFSLSDLYQEQSLFFSYGRDLLNRDSGAKLLGGINAKYLSHGFKRLPEAANACSGFNCSLGADPVLSGKNSKSSIGADLGFIYRFPERFQAGLMIQNAMRPDVGFGGSDKLPMNLRTGLAYKSLWMNLTGELRMDTAPDGSRDKDFIVGAERYFPSLDYGQLGLRGSLGVGSREWRQITMGASYRINKIQFDYGFMLPLGAIKGTDGTHRLALTFHFGAPTAEDDISRELLEKAQQMRAGHGPAGPEYGYEFQEALRPHSLDDPKLAEVKRLLEEGQFRKAHETLVAISKDNPSDESLIRLSKRVDLVAFFYPEFSAPKEHWEVELSTSIRRFFHGQDRSAMLHASYAFNLNPTNVVLDQFLAKVESAVAIKADRLPADNPRAFIDELLYRVEAANNRKDFDQVQRLLKDILELQPDNVTALERVGSVYYIMGRYQDAIGAWTRAVPLETKQNEIDSLKEYIRQAQGKLGLIPVPLPATKEIPKASAPAPTEEAAPAEEETPRAAKKGDVRDIAALYQKGVEHYARGEYLQATAMFLRILQLDPNNAQAKKALARIEQRSPSR